MICSTLASFWKFEYFRRPIYNPVEHLWCSFYCENSKPLCISTKKLHRRCWFGLLLLSILYFLNFFFRLCFLKTLQTFYFFKVFYMIRSLKSVISLMYFTSLNSLNIKHVIIKPFDLLNTIPLTRTKTLVNDLLMLMRNF